MLLIAHRTPRTARGCADLVAHGASMFEADVQLRHDTVVVSHYLGFWRFGPGIQHDNARFRMGYGPPYDLTLDQALAQIPAHCAILLDPKEREPRRRARLIDALARQLPDRSRFAVSTDRPDDLVGFRDAGFRTWRTIKDAAALRAALAGRRLAETGVSARHTLLDAASIAALHRRVDTIAAWTVNEPGRARRLRDLGVDAITTDRPAVLDAVRVRK